MLNKEEFIDMVAKDSGRTKKDTRESLDSILEGIKKAFVYYGGVKFVGFGTFNVKERKERKYRNPNTNEPVIKNETKVAQFAAGKELTEMLSL